MPTAPDLAAVKAYLGTNSGESDADISAALAAEVVAQAAVVRFPADPAPPASPLPYPADLAEALKRRVARNLAMKRLPLAVQQSMNEFGSSAIRLGSTDPEIRRLEAPHRKWVVG
jgi:hypothetical protein